MSKKVDELRNSLQDQLNAAEARLNNVKASLDKASSETEAAITAKLDEAKNKFEWSKREAESAKAKVTAYFDEKKTETKAEIAEWKRERHQKKLDSRADKAEDYAVSAITMAVMTIDEAEYATLEAIASRIDAEVTRSEN